MLEHGITRAGPLMIPARPDMALEFLEVDYVTIQHYGVEIDTLRYNGPALNDFRNRRSTSAARTPGNGRSRSTAATSAASGSRTRATRLA